MESTRFRFGAILEWGLAAAVIVALTGVGSTLLREYRTVRPVVPVIADESRIHETPSGIPAGAVAVPLLILDDGRTVRLGDAMTAVDALVGVAATGAESREPIRGGERVTRFYQAGRRQFVLVCDEPAPGGDPAVVAIYTW